MKGSVYIIILNVLKQKRKLSVSSENMTRENHCRLIKEGNVEIITSKETNEHPECFVRAECGVDLIIYFYKIGISLIKTWKTLLFM